MHRLMVTSRHLPAGDALGRRPPGRPIPATARSGGCRAAPARGRADPRRGAGRLRSTEPRDRRAERPAADRQGRARGPVASRRRLGGLRPEAWPRRSVYVHVKRTLPLARARGARRGRHHRHLPEPAVTTTAPQALTCSTARSWPSRPATSPTGSVARSGDDPALQVDRGIRPGPRSGRHRRRAEAHLSTSSTPKAAGSGDAPGPRTGPTPAARRSAPSAWCC